MRNNKPRWKKPPGDANDHPWRAEETWGVSPKDRETRADAVVESDLMAGSTQRTRETGQGPVEEKRRAVCASQEVLWRKGMWWRIDGPVVWRRGELGRGWRSAEEWIGKQQVRGRATWTSRSACGCSGMVGGMSEGRYGGRYTWQDLKAVGGYSWRAEERQHGPGYGLPRLRLR